LFVLNWLTLGGAERQALLFADELLKRGHKVTFVGLSTPGIVQDMCAERGITCHYWPFYFPPTYREKFNLILGLARKIKSLKPDYIAPYDMVPNLVCALFWRFTGAKAFVWQQRDGGLTRRARILERLAIFLTPRFISNSEHAVEWMCAELGVPRKKIRVVRNGVVLPTLDVASVYNNGDFISSQAPNGQQTVESTQQNNDNASSQVASAQSGKSLRSSATSVQASQPWRKKHGIADDIQLVTMVANIHLLKDHKTLISAWKLVMERHPKPDNLKLILAGNKQSSWPEIEAMINMYGLESSVYSPGVVEDVSALLTDTDVVVLSSHHEGVPNAVLEGMAHAKPVVATEIPGVIETGICYHPLQYFAINDAVACAESIVYLLDVKDEAREVGLKNREIIENKFGVQRMADETIKVFEEVHKNR